MLYDLIIDNARIHDPSGRLPKSARGLALKDGRVAAINPPENAKAVDAIDAQGRLLLPGFVDCHTHAVFAGNRMNEHAKKLEGASYEEIAKAGGGIIATVEAVRQASVDELVEQSLPRVLALAAEGVTSMEIKSGYGLTLDDELKMLEAIGELANRVPMNITPTFLGAHAIPKDRDQADYVNEVCEVMLPAVAEQGIAEAVDVFAERIAFTKQETQRILETAKSLGLKLRAHTDQLSNLGATRAAAELGALSCDHLEYTDEQDIFAMAKAKTVAVLLPGAFYFLKETKKPPVASFREKRVPMAIATDLNPGSSPLASILTAMHMGCIFFGLTPDEALRGVTINAARALGHDDIGHLDVGARADFTLWDLEGPEYLTYQLGGLRPTHTFFHGVQQ
ncbi:MAG: imidazolonepropionase [Gammaproteobacteria bacterium]|nr:imidazolonepropionase [Gammaproteobacteria bacterium]